jgi:cob(I)alamin adenosyltransferase
MSPHALAVHSAAHGTPIRLAASYANDMTPSQTTHVTGGAAAASALIVARSASRWGRQVVMVE